MFYYYFHRGNFIYIVILEIAIGLCGKFDKISNITYFNNLQKNKNENVKKITFTHTNILII